MKTRIIIFAKAPQPGRVKTRLIPALGAEAAARLAREMLERTLSAAVDAACGPVELCMDPAPDDAAWSDTPIATGIGRSAQGAGDLGDRMQRAATRTLTGGEHVVLIGTDCLQMSGRLLREACALLDTADAVMYPVADGGYALLGLKTCAPSLFTGIAWSTPSVATVTRERFRRLGWNLHEGATLNDVDDPADLALWPARN